LEPLGELLEEPEFSDLPELSDFPELPEGFDSELLLGVYPDPDELLLPLGVSYLILSPDLGDLLELFGLLVSNDFLSGVIGLYIILGADCSLAPML
jgi:hypothetical protein